MVEPHNQARVVHRPLACQLLVLVVVLAPLSFMSGCSGCRNDKDKATAEELKKKAAAKKKKKKPYDFKLLETVPSDDTLNRNFVKPGHAVTAWVPAIANENDLRAEFETSVTDVSGRPVLIGDTRYHLVMSRPAVLPKGQWKFLESTFFIPQETGSTSGNVFLRHTLRPARGGRVVHTDSQITRTMPSHQYLFAVLGANPNAYGFVKQLETVSPEYDAWINENDQLVYYRVVLPSVKQRMPLPSHPFAWTMIAAVLWDGVNPGNMTPDQEQSMLDWLHWGGQLIVSGPDTLRLLEGQFLDPYLPATVGDSVQLGPDEFDEMNQSWSLVTKQKKERLALVVERSAPMVGISMVPRAGAEFIAGTGQLVVERRVGRGRIVVSAFPLSHRDLVNWPSYDSFFNSCLLRRPPREFVVDPVGAVQPEWVGQRGGNRSPLYVTTTRYFTRDIGKYPFAPPQQSGLQDTDWHWDGCEPNPTSGLGGWNDNSGASDAARTTLQHAAGVTIPKASFVLAVLAVYLVVLVPVNWLVFRVIGRVEWAWIAAPVIAVVGAVAVIRFAQLDIGFVRSRTEVAILEMQGGYPRAHLTRYTALYSSLSSNYELQFDDTTALTRPFPPTLSPDRLWPVTYRRERNVTLSGFQVDSNTTGFVHSEQMGDMGGAIRLVGERPVAWQIENASDINLHHVGVFYRDTEGRLQTCWLGKLPAKTTVPLVLEPSSSGDIWLDRWDPGQVVAEQGGQSAADLTDLTILAARGMRLRNGAMRLVGWTDGFFPGLTIDPPASQTQTSNVVLVHLQYGPLPAPTPDVNVAREVRENVMSDDKLEILPQGKEGN